MSYENKNYRNTGYNLSDAEKGGNQTTTGNWGDFGGGLSDKVIRIQFIRKVYSIITLQLLFTFGIVSIFVFAQPVKEFARTTAGFGLYMTSYVIFIVTVIALTCCSRAPGIRKFPVNYILLSLVTLTMSYMLGMISSYHDISAVLIAVGVTLVVVIGVTLVSMQTKYDFTNCWLLMICLSFAFLGFGIACAIASAFSGPQSYILQAVYGGLGAVLMSMFLAIDTQMLIGGKRKFQFSPEDYIYAALQIYLDICYIFMYVLQAVGAGKR